MADDKKLEYELILSVHRTTAVIASDISAIKTDLKEHIRRTTIAEQKIEHLQQNMFRAQGAIILISILATIITIARYFIK